MLSFTTYTRYFLYIFLKSSPICLNAAFDPMGRGPLILTKLRERSSAPSRTGQGLQRCYSVTLTTKPVIGFENKAHSGHGCKRENNKHQVYTPMITVITDCNAIFFSLVYRDVADDRPENVKFVLLPPRKID